LNFFVGTAIDFPNVRETFFAIFDRLNHTCTVQSNDLLLETSLFLTSLGDNN